MNPLTAICRRAQTSATRRVLSRTVVSGGGGTRTTWPAGQTLPAQHQQQENNNKAYPANRWPCSFLCPHAQPAAMGHSQCILVCLLICFRHVTLLHTGGECGVVYDRRMRMPAPPNIPASAQPEYYSYVVGPIAVIVLSTEQKWASGSLQYT
jgi:hypothetical protein